MSALDKIPSSVLDLLRERWKEAEPGYSGFEAVFVSKPGDDDRKRYPSYYHIAAGQKIENDFDRFSHAEALALLSDGAFGSMAKTYNPAKDVSINEHAAHAMQDFLQETYSAWNKYRRRLEEIEQACPALT